MKRLAPFLLLAALLASGLLARTGEEEPKKDVGKSPDNPVELIIGEWLDEAEPDDAVIRFSKDGTGTITETTPTKTAQAQIKWEVERRFGNACVVTVEYQAPKPKGIEPFTWLIAFDGKDSFVTQPVANKIVIMKRKS